MEKPINNITQDDVSVFKHYTTRPNEISHGNLMDLYQRTATKSAKYPGQNTALGLMYLGLKLNEEAGELAGHIGKAMRDDGLIALTAWESNAEGVGTVVDANLLPGTGLTSDRRDLIVKEIGDTLWYLSAICNELGISLSDAATGNLEKLQSRTKRGTLQGSGDTR